MTRPPPPLAHARARALALGAGVAVAAAIALVACRTDDDGAGPSGAAASPVPCDAGATCPAGRLVGTVSGDKGADSLTTSGSTTTWVHVRVTEDDDSVSGRPVRLRAKLTAPSSGGFEVRGYLADSRNNDAGLDCTRLVGTSSPSSGSATLDLAWGDPPDATANGVDDGRTVALEVRNVSGACSSSPWRLELRGNPSP